MSNERVTLRITLGIVHLIGSLIGRLMYMVRGSRYRFSRINIKLCFPELSSDAVNDLSLRSLIEAGKLFSEFLLLWFVASRFCDKWVVNVIGEEHMHNALAAGKGVIILTPHLGNWEIFNAYAGKFKPCVSYKPVGHSWLDNKIRRSRELSGSKLVPITTQGIKALYTELKNSGSIMMLPDQVPKQTGKSGRVMAPFFGHPAWTGTLTSRLAQKSGAAVICGFARRLPEGCGFEIRLRPAPTEIYSNDLEESATALNSAIEMSIRDCPQQYTWQYKRFKGTADKQVYTSNKTSQ